MNREDLTDLNLIADVVCDYFKIDILTMLEKTRKRDIIVTRQFFQFLSRELNPEYVVSGFDIGNFYSKNLGFSYDHATVLHSYNVISGLIEVDKNYKKTYNILLDKINLRKEISNKQESKKIKTTTLEAVRIVGLFFNTMPLLKEQTSQKVFDYSKKIADISVKEKLKTLQDQCFKPEQLDIIYLSMVEDELNKLTLKEYFKYVKIKQNIIKTNEILN